MQARTTGRLNKKYSLPIHSLIITHLNLKLISLFYAPISVLPLHSLRNSRRNGLNYKFTER